MSWKYIVVVPRSIVWASSKSTWTAWDVCQGEMPAGADVAEERNTV